MRIPILLMDPDIGFTFWLGELLDRAGFEAFPAKDIPDAEQLLKRLPVTVELVILDCTLRGAEGFISGLRQEQQNLKTICTVPPGKENSIPGAVTLERDRMQPGEEAAAVWIEKVRQTLGLKTRTV
jgi:hypothetical protein